MSSDSHQPIHITLQPLNQTDLNQVSEMVRLAFATFIDVPEPDEFWNDRDYVHNRWNAPHSHWVKAVVDGRMIGVICVSRWGSSAILGPVAVHPDFWGKGVVQQLMSAGIEQVDRWGVAHTGLMTFPDSAKHIGLYQQFGFWPQSLIAIMERSIHKRPTPQQSMRYGPPGSDETRLKAACLAITEAIAPGLDLSGEIDAVHQQNLGTTLIITAADGQPEAFAICHFGPQSEAGAGVFYVKFAAVIPGPQASSVFARLMTACDAAALQAGQEKLVAGVNTARTGAYRWMINDGFRTDILGISMHRSGTGYDGADTWVLDDWR